MAKEVKKRGNKKREQNGEGRIWRGKNMEREEYGK